MKKVITATALALVLSTSVMASPSQSDMSQVFGNQATTSNVSELSKSEMKETEGEWVGLVIRALIAAFNPLTTSTVYSN